eukprot:TRINITY_DN21125_c0_g1_i1.p1 TRINITY_DN21125_c0_g1~~TRINITY_DN21125_c0_g1_i1.p1  ORF type:complete len:436 (+),score=77.75 TRINITY_DN21125_c0_g1_i1:157-1464(+)
MTELALTSHKVGWRCVLLGCLAISPSCLLQGCGGKQLGGAARSGKGDAITRVLHQQFHTSDPRAWPPEWRSLSSLWQEKHPEREWRFWTDAQEANIFREQLPEFQEMYQQIPTCLSTNISQADLSTYAILYLYGGVYADMDTAPLAALGGVLEAAVEATGRHLAVVFNIARPDDCSEEIRGGGGFIDPFATDTDIMAATAPGQPFFYQVLQSIHAYLAENNQTICGRDTQIPTYDLMFLTAWGRLSMCLRAWSDDGMDWAGLHFLESLFLHDAVDGVLIHTALHTLANTSLEDLQLHPPPRGGLLLERWLQKSLQRQLQQPTKRAFLWLTPPDSETFYGLLQASDLLILLVAVSPYLPKAALRRLHLKCHSDLRCFQDGLETAIANDFQAGSIEQSLAVVFNQDAGVWEGSWNEARQQAFLAEAKLARKEQKKEL